MFYYSDDSGHTNYDLECLHVNKKQIMEKRGVWVT